MNRIAFFLPLVFAAALISCASAPGQKTAPGQIPETSQEQTAAVAAPAPAAEASLPAAAPETAAAAASPTEESIQPPAQAAEQPAPPADAALTLPKAPQRAQSVVAEDDLSLPAAHPGPAKFPMTSPQPPAAVSRKPAAAPDRGQVVPRAPAPASPKPAQQADVAAGRRPGSSSSASAGPAPAGAPAAASAAAAGTTAPSTYGKLREIYARVGDDVQIGLDGQGFLFLGFPDRSPDGDGMSFKGKETREGKTWFTFRALKLGTYDLDFLMQDNATGSSAKETVRVHVVSDADFSSAVAQGPGQAAAPSETGDPAFADRLASLGQYDAAIAELLKGYREGNPDLNDRIGRLYLRTGSYDAAAKYFTKNLSAAAPYGDAAVTGLAKVAIAQKDQADLLSLLKKLLLVKDPGLEETLIAAARFEKEKHEIGVGIDLASEYAARYPAGRWRDEANFILAQLLEADSQFRDIARARAIYRGILDQHPESPFAPLARDRVEYIDRHFFEVR